MDVGDYNVRKDLCELFLHAWYVFYLSKLLRIYIGVYNVRGDLCELFLQAWYVFYLSKPNPPCRAMHWEWAGGGLVRTSAQYCSTPFMCTCILLQMFNARKTVMLVRPA